MSIDIEQWITDHENQIYGQYYIKTGDLEELLKTHALVPREPTEAQIKSMLKVEGLLGYGTDRNIIDLYTDEYKSAIAAAEKS